MYCPECGFDAGEANFCPECGNDLTAFGDAQPESAPGVCPQCGAEDDEASFCPECGEEMPAGHRQLRQKRAAGSASQPRGQSQRQQRPRSARRAEERRGYAQRSGSGRTVAYIWLGFAAAAVIVVLVIMMVAGGGGTNAATSSAADAPASDALTAAADTSGSYSELVARANDLYDKGIAAYNNNDVAAGEQNFRDAAEVYKAAWSKEPGDPNVGTDYAVALFYRRHHDEGLQQIETVLKKNPRFQPALLNRGIFLQAESDEAEQRGETEKAAQFLADAKQALEKAVRIDPDSESGKRAAQVLQEM